MWSRSRQSPSRLTASRALTVAISSMIALNLTSGIGFAYWTSIGSGSATIKATNAAPLGVTSVAVPLADLFPGKTSDLGLTLSNSNPYSVSLTQLTSVSVTSSNEAGCSGATYISLPAAVVTALSGGGAYTLSTAIPVPSGSTSTVATLPGFITMTTSAPDACQGQTFTVSLGFSGSQV